MRITVRDQVKAAIITTMAKAEQAGQCPLAAAETTFPGIPGMVLGECFADLQMAQESAWWETVERTIDGEVIRNAVVVAGGR